MNPRWLIALGIGSGFVLSGFLSGLYGLAHGTELLPGESLEAASVSPLPRPSSTPAKLGARPRAARSLVAQKTPHPSSADLLAEDDEDQAEDAALLRSLDEAFRNVSLEARDEAWASVMEKSVEAALEHVVEAAPVAVGKPDCRTRHCQLEIEWSDRDAAMTAGGDVLAMLPGECVRTMTRLDAEQDEYDTYRSRVLLDCPRVQPQR